MYEDGNIETLKMDAYNYHLRLEILALILILFCVKRRAIRSLILTFYNNFHSDHASNH